MIHPRKSLPTLRFFQWYFLRRLKRDFSGIHIHRGDELVQPAGAPPLIILPNHSSWWDAVMPVYVSTLLHSHDVYAMMEERQLARHRFFRRLGAFSVVREDPRQAAVSMRHAITLLQDGSRVLWMYPEGRFAPPERRPLHLEPGLAHLAARTGRVRLLPLALSYCFLERERPDIFIACGESIHLPMPVAPERDALTRILTDALERTLTAQQVAIRTRAFAGYHTALGTPLPQSDAP